MSDDQFTKLFKYMQGEFGQIRAKLSGVRTELKRDINRIYGLLDDNIKQQETDEQERLATNRQLDRHEGWIKQISKSTNTKLVPDP